MFRFLRSIVAVNFLLVSSLPLLARDPISIDFQEVLPEGSKKAGRLEIFFQNGYVIVRHLAKFTLGFQNSDLTIEPATKVPQIILTTKSSVTDQKSLILQLRTEPLLLDGEQRFFIGKPSSDLLVHVAYDPDDQVEMKDQVKGAKLFDITDNTATDLPSLDVSKLSKFAVKLKDEANAKTATVDGYFVVSDSAQKLIDNAQGSTLTMYYAETNLALSGTLTQKGFFEFRLDGNKLHISHQERRLLGFAHPSGESEFQPAVIDDLPLLVSLQIDGQSVVLNPGDFVGRENVSYTLAKAPSRIKVMATGKGIVFYHNMLATTLPELSNSLAKIGPIGETRQDVGAGAEQPTSILEADHIEQLQVAACAIDKNCGGHFFYTDYSVSPVKSGEFVFRWIDAETLEVQHVSFSDFSFLAGTKHRKEGGAPGFPLNLTLLQREQDLGSEIAIFPESFAGKESVIVKFRGLKPSADVEIHISKPPTDIVFNQLLGTPYRPSAQLMSDAELAAQGCSQGFVMAPMPGDWKVKK